MIVLAERMPKDDTGDNLETVDPRFPAPSVVCRGRTYVSCSQLIMIVG